MKPFNKMFPKVAENETRVMHVLRETEENPFPPDEYVFVESYCEEKGCDCRRVMIAVFSNAEKRVLATINMGFDSREPDAGPFLDPLNLQSQYSQAFLDFFLNMINQDKLYLERLRKHYVMVKEHVEKKPYQGKPFEPVGSVLRTEQAPLPLEFPPLSELPPKVGRNAPCLCGSGKKYKKCCLNKTEGGKTSTGSKKPVPKKESSGSSAKNRGTLREPGSETDTTRIASRILKRVSSRLSARKSDPLRGDIHATLQEKPTLAFDFLSILMRDYGGKMGNTNPGVRYDALLLLVEETLTELRYSQDRKRPWAMNALKKIQKQIAEDVCRRSVDARVQMDVLKALHEAGLEIDQEIRKKTEELAQYYGKFIQSGSRSPHGRQLENISKATKGNIFFLYEEITSNLAVLPTEAKLYALHEMVKTGNSLMVEAVVLMLLSPDSELRSGVATLLNNQSGPTSIPPAALRRMIGFRNWLPKNERSGVDRLIKNARLGGVACDAMPTHAPVTIYASAFDGSGMQVISGIFKKQRAWGKATVLVRQGEGIRDALFSPRMPRSEIKGHQQLLKGQLASLKVGLDYLKKLMPHFMHVGREAGSPPPPAFLAAAEFMGNEYWQPRSLDFEKEIAELETALPPDFGERTALSKVMEDSRKWTEKAFGHSWFEDDARVDECIRKHAGGFGNKPGGIIKAQEVILQEILEEKRRDWGERIFWMALRSLLCRESKSPAWAAFLIVSREIFDGTPLKNIPLMEAVAERTLLSGLRRLNEFPG